MQLNLYTAYTSSMSQPNMLIATAVVPELQYMHGYGTCHALRHRNACVPLDTYGVNVWASNRKHYTYNMQCHLLGQHLTDFSHLSLLCTVQSLVLTRADMQRQRQASLARWDASASFHWEEMAELLRENHRAEATKWVTLIVPPPHSIWDIDSCLQKNPSHRSEDSCSLLAKV